MTNQSCDCPNPPPGRCVPAGVKAFIQAHQRFLVLGHKEPDGDCVASQIVCADILCSLGKEAGLYSAGPFDNPEIAPLAKRFATTVPGDRLAAPSTAVVVLDCSGLDRLGGLGSQVTGLPSLVIDHHESGSAFGDVRYVVPGAPATTMLVLSLFDIFGLVPSAEQARLLFFGLGTDTGFFRHLRGGSGETLRTAALLTDLGAAPAEVFGMMYGGRSLENRRLLAGMIDRVESHCDDRLLLTWLSLKDRQAVTHYERGDDDLYRLLQTVRGNEVVVLIKEEGNGEFSVGLRSRQVDVGAVARSFGGGGHRCAAGFDAPGPLQKIRQSLLGALLPEMSSSRTA